MNMSSYYHQLLLPFNEPHVGRISHSAGPGEFYVQLSERAPQLNELMDFLRVNYVGAKSFTAPPPIGTPLVAIFPEDGEFYRATMMGIVQSNDPNKPLILSVFYCDYGNYGEVTLKQVFPCREELFKYPQFCFEASLNFKHTFTNEQKAKFDEQFPLDTDFSFKAVFNEGDMKNMRYQIVLTGAPGVTAVPPNGRNGQNSQVTTPSRMLPLNVNATSPVSTTGLNPVRSTPMHAAGGQRWKVSSLEPVNLNIGDEVSVVLVSVTRFKSFGVHLKSLADNLIKLKESMYQFFQANKHSLSIRDKDPNKIAPGDVFAVFSEEDNEWGRFSVLSFSGMIVNLVNIDYGDTIEVKVDELYEVPDMFIKAFPKYLISCDLHGVDCDPAFKTLPADVLGELESCLETFGTNSSYSNSLTITAILELVEREKLVSSNKTYSVILKSYGQSSPVIINDLMKNKIQLTLTKLQANDHQNVNNNNNSIQSPELELPLKKDAELLSTYLPILKLPSVGTFTNARIVYAESPSELYIVLQKYLDDFENISERMSAVYGVDDGASYALTSKIADGMLCAAKFTEDNCWYRAKVLKYDYATQNSLVLFLDYGNRENVGIVNMRKLDGSLYQYPALAIKCQIEKLAISWPKWSSEVRDAFLEKVIEQDFNVRVDPSVSNCVNVTLIDQSGEDVSISMSKLANTAAKYSLSEQTTHSSKEASVTSPRSDTQFSRNTNKEQPRVFDARDVINSRQSSSYLKQPLNDGDEKENDKRRDITNRLGTLDQSQSVGFRSATNAQNQHQLGDKSTNYGRFSDNKNSPNYSGFSEKRSPNFGGLGDSKSPKKEDSFERRNFNESERGGSSNRGRFPTDHNPHERSQDKFNSFGEGAVSRGSFRGNASSDRNEGGKFQRESRDCSGLQDGGSSSRGFQEGSAFSDGQFEAQTNFQGGSRGRDASRAGFRGAAGSRGGFRDENSSRGGFRDENSSRGFRNENSLRGGFNNSSTSRDGGDSFGGGFGGERKAQGGFRGASNSRGGRQEDRKRNASSNSQGSNKDASGFPENRKTSTSSGSSGFEGKTQPRPVSVAHDGMSAVLKDFDLFLPVGEIIKCRVIKIRSPSDFSILLLDQWENLNKLIKDYLSDTSKVKLPTKVEAKFCYLLPLGPTEARRVEVVNVYENESKCDVSFCDTLVADKTGVPIKRLISMNEEIASICKLELKCRLHGVTGSGTIGDDPTAERDWLLSGYNKFKDLVDTKIVEVRVRCRDVTSNFVTLEIVNLSSENKTMSELLLENKMAADAQLDYELENANHITKFYSEKVYDMIEMEGNGNKQYKLLACVDGKVWICNEAGVEKQEEMVKVLLSFFKETSEMDKLKIKKPLINYYYTAIEPMNVENTNETIVKRVKRCVVENICEDTDENLAIRYIDYGVCDKVSSVYAYPACLLPYKVFSMIVNVTMQIHGAKQSMSSLSPYCMFELSLWPLSKLMSELSSSQSESAPSFDYLVKFAKNGINGTHTLELNGQHFNDVILKLSWSKNWVDNMDFETDSVTVKVVEVFESESDSGVRTKPVFTVFPLEQEAKRLKLEKELKAFYEQYDVEMILPNLQCVNPLLLDDFELAAGSFVVFMWEAPNESSTEEPVYRRGEIESIVDSNIVKVRSIDYGTMHYISKDNLRKLALRFSSYSSIQSAPSVPALSMQCVAVNCESEQLRELVDKQVTISLLHLGRLNLVSIDSGDNEKQDSDSDPVPETDSSFTYPLDALNDVDINRQCIDIAHLDTPVDFSYTLSRFRSEIENLNIEMEILWESLTPSWSLEQLQSALIDDFGKYLYAYYCDEKYFRVKVISLEPPTVLFIDSNDTRKVHSELKRLPNYLASIPPFSAKLHIPNLIPIEGDTFVEVENEIVKKHVSKHVCVICEENEVVFNGHAYCDYVVNACEVAMMENNVSGDELLPPWRCRRIAQGYKISSFDIEKEKDNCELVVSAVDKQFVWVQISSTQSRIEKVQSVLNDLYTESYSKQSECKLRRPVLGKVCVATFSEDDAWYRSEVIENNDDNQNEGENGEHCCVTVRFVDFGNYEKVKVDQLCELFLEKENEAEAAENDGGGILINEPKFAVPVRVEGMEELMNFDVLDYLQENLVSEKIALGDIIETSSAENELSKVALISTAKLSFQGKDLIDTINYIKSNPVVPPHDMSDMRTMKGVATYINDDAVIYIQDTKRMDQLANLMQKLREKYSEIGEEQLKIEKIDRLDYLVVKSPLDSEFYRAQLVDILNDENENSANITYQVFLVDYGDVIECPDGECWKLDRQLATEAPFAYCCSLFDCKMKEDKIEDAVGVLREMLLPGEETQESPNGEAAQVEIECEFLLRLNSPYKVNVCISGQEKSCVREVLKEKDLIDVADPASLDNVEFESSAKIGAIGSVCYALWNASPDYIIVQLGGDENVRLLLLQDDIDYFYNKLKTKSTTDQGDHSVTFQNEDEIFVGLSVIVFDPDYKSYCRAIVEEKSEAESYILNLVDWGRRIDNVKHKDLLRVEEMFVRVLSPQAIYISLQSVIPDEDDSYIASDEQVLTDIIGQGELLVSLANSQQKRNNAVEEIEGNLKILMETSFPIEVHVKIVATGEDLAQQLIQRGICRESETEEKPWIKIPSDLHGLEIGSKKEVNIASVGQKGFHVQFEDNIDEITSLLNAYTQDDKLRKVLRRPKVGKICVTKYEQDQLYYRAEIIDLDQDKNLATVIFIDYRNEQEKIAFSELYEIGSDSRLLDIPCCCVEFMWEDKVSALMNWDVENELSNTITLFVEELPLPKCVVEIKHEAGKQQTSEEEDIKTTALVASLFLDDVSLYDRVKQIRSHPCVELGRLQEMEETDLLLNNFENVESLYLIRKANMAVRDQFTIEMTQFYNHVTNPEQLKIEMAEFEPGCHIAYKVIPNDNPLEGKWFRACVEDLELSNNGSGDNEKSRENVKLSLRLLDTGAKLSDCDINLCKKLTKELATKQASLVIHCRLFQVRNKESVSLSTVKDRVVKLIKAIDHVPFKCCVVSRTCEVQSIDVYLPDGGGENTLTQSLIGEDLVDSAPSPSNQHYKSVLDELNRDSQIEVAYVHSVSPMDITFQTVLHSEKLTLLEEDLRAYVEFIETGDATDTIKADNHPEQFETSEPCMAQFPDDELWYRAIIIPNSNEELSECDSAMKNVYFIDWGNSSMVSNSNIRSIPIEFCELPAQAIHCAIDDILPIVGSEWIEEDNEILSEFLLKMTENQEKVTIELKNVSNGDKSDDVLSKVYSANVFVGVEKNSTLSMELELLGVARAKGSDEVVPARLKRSVFNLLEDGVSDVVVWVSALEPVNFNWNYDSTKDQWEWKSNEVCGRDEEKLGKVFVWIQLDTNDDELNQLNKALTTHSNSNSLKKMHRVRQGKVGTIKSKVVDNSWIRVEVISVFENSTTGEKNAKVRAVDYGHAEIVEQLEAIKEIGTVDAAWDKPCFALPVTVEDIQLDELDIDACEHLAKRIVFNETEEVILKISSIDQNLANDSADCPVLTARLVFNGMSLKEHVLNLSEPVVIAESLQTCTDVDSETMSTSNRKMVCLLTHIQSVDQVYIQKSSDWGKMSKMLKNLNQFYESLQPGRYINKCLCVGDYVAFKVSVSEDGEKWKRGQILTTENASCGDNTDEKNLFEVLNVDKGTRALVSKCNIRKLTSQFATQNKFAMKTSLFGVKSTGPELEQSAKIEEIKSSIDSLVAASGELIAHFFSDNHHIRLELDKSVDLCAHLIKENFVETSDVFSGQFPIDAEQLNIDSTVNCVFVQVDPQIPNRVMFQIGDSNQQLIDLEQDMNLFYDNEQLRNALNFNLDLLTPNSVCAIKSALDSGWHRAIIKKVQPPCDSISEAQQSQEGVEYEIDVFVLDWGNEEKLLFKSSCSADGAADLNVMPILCEFVDRIPAQSVIVDLASICPDEDGKDWLIPDDCDQMTSIFEGFLETMETFQVKITTFDSETRVAIGDISMCDANNVTKSVCDIAVYEKGFANFKGDSHSNSSSANIVFKLPSLKVDNELKVDLDFELKLIDSQHFIVSPIQCSSQGRADSVLEQLNHLVSTPQTKILQKMRRPEVGKNCIVLHSDEMYYRAQLSEIKQHEKDGKVLLSALLVDFGEYCEVEPSKCFQISRSKEASVTAFRQYVTEEAICCLKLKIPEEVGEIDKSIEDEIWSYITENDVGIIKVEPNSSSISNEDLTFSADRIMLKNFTLKEFLKSLTTPPKKLNVERQKAEDGTRLTGAISYQSQDCLYFQLETDFEQIEKLQCELIDSYANEETSDKSKKMLQEVLEKESIVACKCSEDGKWYRVQIVDEEEDGEGGEKEYKVRMIDYGFTDQVKIDRLNILHSKFLQIPRMAIPCVFNDVVLVSDDGYQVERMIQLLDKYYINADLETVRIVVKSSNEETSSSNPDMWPIEIVSEQSENTFNALLVEKQIAEFVASN